MIVSIFYFKPDLTAHFRVCYNITSNSGHCKKGFTQRGVIASHDVLKHILSIVGGITKNMNPQNVCWNDAEEDEKANDIEMFDIGRHGLIPKMKTVQPLILKHTPQPLDPRLRDGNRKHLDHQANVPLIPLNYTFSSSPPLDPSIVKYSIAHTSPLASPFSQDYTTFIPQ